VGPDPSRKYVGGSPCVLISLWKILYSVGLYTNFRRLHELPRSGRIFRMLRCTKIRINYIKQFSSARIFFSLSFL